MDGVSMDRALSTEALADRWMCNVKQIQRMLRRGELQAFKVGGKEYRVRLEEVERYERSGGGKNPATNTAK